MKGLVVKTWLLCGEYGTFLPLFDFSLLYLSFFGNTGWKWRKGIKNVVAMLCLKQLQITVWFLYVCVEQLFQVENNLPYFVLLKAFNVVAP